MTRLTETEIAEIHGGLGVLEAVAYATVAVSLPITINALFNCTKWCGNNHRLHMFIAGAAGFLGVFAVYFATSDK